MADEYIRREDAVEETLKYIISSGVSNQSTWDECVRTIADTLQDMRPADVAPVAHSRWIKTADGAECEKCGREAVYQIVDDHWEYEPFCPHCGSIMDNKRGNENG